MMVWVANLVGSSLLDLAGLTPMFVICPLPFSLGCCVGWASRNCRTAMEGLCYWHPSSSSRLAWVYNMLQNGSKHSSGPSTSQVSESVTFATVLLAKEGLTASPEHKGWKKTSSPVGRSYKATCKGVDNRKEKPLWLFVQFTTILQVKLAMAPRTRECLLGNISVWK